MKKRQHSEAGALAFQDYSYRAGTYLSVETTTPFSLLCE